MSISPLHLTTAAIDASLVSNRALSRVDLDDRLTKAYASLKEDLEAFHLAHTQRPSLLTYIDSQLALLCFLSAPRLTVAHSQSRPPPYGIPRCYRSYDTAIARSRFPGPSTVDRGPLGGELEACPPPRHRLGLSYSARRRRGSVSVGLSLEMYNEELGKLRTEVKRLKAELGGYERPIKVSKGGSHGSQVGGKYRILLGE